MAVKQLLGMSLVFALNIWISAAAEEASTDSDAPPYTFVKGQPGKASQINDNFKGIYQRVGELERLIKASEKATTAAVDCTENPSALREFFLTDAAASNSTSITVTITGSCLGGLFWIAKVVTLIGADSDAKIYTPADDLGPNPAQVVGTGFGGFLGLRNLRIESVRSRGGHSVMGYMGGNIFLNDVTLNMNNVSLEKGTSSDFSGGLALIRGSRANLAEGSFLKISSNSQGIFVNSASSLVLKEGSEVDVKGGHRGLYFRQGSTLFDRTKSFSLQGSIYAIDSKGNSIWDRDYGAGQLTLDGNVNFQDSVFVSENNNASQSYNGEAASVMTHTNGEFEIRSSRFVTEKLTIAGDLVGNRADIEIMESLVTGVGGSVKLTESDMSLGFTDTPNPSPKVELLNSNLTAGFSVTSLELSCEGYSTVKTADGLLLTGSNAVCQ